MALDYSIYEAKTRFFSRSSDSGGTLFSGYSGNKFTINDRCDRKINLMKRTTESTFESTIEAHLLHDEYVSIAGDSFDREHVIFSEIISPSSARFTQRSGTNSDCCTATRPRKYSATCTSGWTSMACSRRGGTDSTATVERSAYAAYCVNLDLSPHSAKYPVYDEKMSHMNDEQENNDGLA